MASSQPAAAPHRVRQRSRGEVSVDPARATEGGVEPDPPVSEPAVPVLIGFTGPLIHLQGQAREITQFRAACCGPAQDPVRGLALSVGKRSVHSQNCRAHEHDSSPATSASSMTGWVRSRRIQATEPRAACLVVRVWKVSHIRALPRPSSSGPRCAENAAKIRERATVWRDSARSRHFRASAWVAVGREAASSVAR
ncbi:MAG TPA: hypothetical protein VGS19_21160 [Streptosporangiaceae bacterium]|nr:hypothetical protein [Streptosporangiaceae bacterium]